MKQLLERGLVRIAGEDDSLGRPYLYGTTRQFLELFGLHRLEDLPDAARLRAPAAQSAMIDGVGDSVERVQIFKQTGSKLNNDFQLTADGKLFDKNAGKVVIMTGRPDLVVWVVDL